MRGIAAGVLIVVLVASCGGSPSSSTTTTSAADTTSTTEDTTTTSATTQPPVDAGVQTQIDWYVALLNGAAFDEDEYETRFAAVFRDQIPTDQFVAVVDQVKAAASGWRIIAVVGAEPNAATVRVSPLGGDPVLLLSLSIDSTGAIDGLFVQPDAPLELDDPPETIDGAADRLAGIGTLGFVVADVRDGACVVRDGRDADVAAPIGSMFKLYVLGAVVDAVAAGIISWDQPVEIQDRYRSLPSGIVQSDPPGSSRTVRELSELMISISDNTATDHLLFLVGRAAVEQAQRDYGHGSPEINVPFLSTAELFVLKLAERPDVPGSPGALGAAYLAADEAGRRAILEDEVPRYPVEDLDLAGWDRPIAVDGLEWFASPLDLCRVLVALEGDPEAARILAANPGLPDAGGLWSSIGFKGGSEPGVLGMAWYLAADDGAASVVAGSVWNADVAFDEIESVLLFGAIRDLSG